MEPWITLAEKVGCRAVCEGLYLGAENASDNMDEETFAAINRAVVRAVRCRVYQCKGHVGTVFVPAGASGKRLIGAVVLLNLLFSEGEPRRERWLEMLFKA